MLGTSVLVSMAAGELAVRMAGYRAWEPPQLQYEVTPAGRLLEPDAELGYDNVPGDFAVRMAWGRSFRVRVDDRGRRWSHEADERAPSKGAIWILGGSYTQGWLANDEESYPWLLQSRLPEYEIVNFGVPGYGTLQSLLQFERALATDPAPAIVVLAYASFHDIRNTVVRRLLKARLVREADEIQLPRGRLGADGSLLIDMVPVDFVQAPLMQMSALMHLLEETWNRIELRMTPSHETTRAVIARLHDECVRRGIRLVIVGITNHPDTIEMLEYWRQRGVVAADISFDAEAHPQFRYPHHDDHPSPQGHAHYAERLQHVLAAIGVQ